MKLAVVDVETTGLFPSVDRVIEVAVVVMEEGRRTRQFCSLVNPRRDVGPTSIHGISAEDVFSAPTFSELAGHIVAALDGTVALVGHNVWFDNSFLKAEFERMGQDWPHAPTVCTMGLAGGGRLTQCCEEFGVPLPTQAHSAEADAIAAAELLNRLLPDSPSEIRRLNRLPPVRWPAVSPSSIDPIRRDQARSKAEPAVKYLDRLLTLVGAPVNPDDTAGMQYVDLLSRFLEDRRLDSSESEQLLRLAGDLGLSGLQVRELHSAFLEQLVLEAFRDGVLTELESHDLSRVARLLGQADSAVEAAIQKARRQVSSGNVPPGAPREDMVGKRVCFTGESQCVYCSEPLTREKAAALATRHGLVVVESVTKKLDLLVVADPYSQSGKAAKARKYGIRVIHEPAFWSALGAEVN